MSVFYLIYIYLITPFHGLWNKWTSTIIHMTQEVPSELKVQYYDLQSSYKMHAE